MPEGLRASIDALAGIERAPSVVTIGNFDGVHRGHQRLIEQTVAVARRRGVRAVAVTFEPHPVKVLRPEVAPARLTDVATRRHLLESAGIDLVVVLPFTGELAQLSPQAFIELVLVEGLAARHVVVGANFRFGHRAVGDIDTLTAAGRQARERFEVSAVDLQQLDGAIVSTSAIRAALERGDVEAAAAALGRPHGIVGTVVHGDGRGRTIGVPTANVAVDDDIVVPAHGVYAGCFGVAGRWLPCVTNVGVRPTVGDDQVAATVEAHVLDETVEVYGAQVAVTFVRRLRGEHRFETVDALVAQIRRDITDARRVVADAAGCRDGFPVPHW